jgi:hypothetical protein
LNDIAKSRRGLSGKKKKIEFGRRSLENVAMPQIHLARILVYLA